MRWGLTSAIAVFILAPTLASAPAWAVTEPTTGARPELDARAGDRAAVPADVQQARSELDKRLGAEGAVRTETVTGGIRAIARTDGALTRPAGGGADPRDIALGYLRAHLDAFGLDAADVGQLRAATDSTSPDGITHVTWQQSPGGVPAYDSGLYANVAADGRLLSIGGAPVHALAPPSTAPPLGPGAALAAAQTDLGVPVANGGAVVGGGPERATTFADGSTASLTVLADPDGDRLAWRVITAGEAPYVYEVLVDAATGAVLTRHSLTDFASSARVHEAYPGADGPSAAGSDRTVDLAAAGYFATTTPANLTGKWVHAFGDLTNDDIPEEIAPSSGSNFSFTAQAVTPASGKTCPTVFSRPCTWDGLNAASAQTNLSQVTTQVFYFASRYHDWLRDSPEIRFTPSSFNFEAAGGDAVQAEVDAGGASTLNNASMSTLPDGQPPKMQMYLFSSPYPAVSGGDDATVVDHEYTHGLTNRLVGNDGQANGLTARQSKAMGEGWSDYYALDFLTDQGMITDDPATPGDEVIGAYVANNAAHGIRFNAVDCPVDPNATSPSCPGSPPAGKGGFTFGDLGRIQYATDAAHPYFEVHADGEIWSETLWDLRTAIGADDARALITSALRLSPKNPSFLDMRDAILLADESDPAQPGRHHDEIWSVFAHRGMGYGASTDGAQSTRGVPSTQVPPVLASGAPDVTALDLGETATLHIPVLNPGGTPLTGVHATLTSTTGGVGVPIATADLGTVPAGGSAPATFSVAVDPSVACGAQATFSLALTSDQGASTVPVALPIGSGRATATRTESPAKVLFDGQRNKDVTSTLAITSHTRLDHLRVTLLATHTWIGDLHIRLTSPQGTTVDLLERPGPGDYGSGANLLPSSPITFDDASATSIQDVTAGDSVTLSGVYRPDEPLSRFAGQDPAGTWTLQVIDNVSPDGGSLSGWSLETDDPACAVTGAAAPSTTSAALTGRVDAGATATDIAFDLGTTAAYGTRVAGGTAAAGSGRQEVGVTATGLAPGTTYHYRLVALRGGAVADVGADQTFTTAPAPGGGGAGDGGGGGGSGGSDGAGTLKLAAPTLKGVPTSLRPDAKGRLTLSFTATPPNETGRITITAKAVKTVGSVSFRVPKKGKVKVIVTLSSKARAYLRKHRSLKTTIAVRIGTRMWRTTLILRPAPKAKAKSKSKR